MRFHYSSQSIIIVLSQKSMNSRLPPYLSFPIILQIFMNHDDRDDRSRKEGREIRQSINMFRKPKKRPLALRSTSSTPTMATPNHDGDDAGQVGYDEVKQVFKNVDGDGDGSNSDNNANVEEDATSHLLKQLRNERLEKIANKSSSLMTTCQSQHSNKRKKPNNNKNINNSNWMHQFKSNDGEGNDGTTTASSARDMATRTAEYHPHASSKTTTNKTTSSNSTTSSTSSTINPSHATAQQINSATLSSHQAPRSKFLAGPLRASTFVRTTVRFDYQPDICKDYKETGFCGFGDTCIYLHDRGETKSGWEMEQEYEDNKKRESQKREKEMERFMEGMMCGEIGTGEGGGGSNKNKNNNNNNNNNNNDDNNTGFIDDGLPYACHICRGAFTNPIVTSCQHYFCEECLLARIRGSSGQEGTSSTCPICQKDTNGVLNHPRKLEAKKRRLVGRDGTWDQYYEVGRKRQRGGG